MYYFNEFASREALDSALAARVAKLLSQAITLRGAASIAVSGGSTPKGFFQALSLKPLPWDKVTVTLADERWIDPLSDASNARLVQQNLLQNEAGRAKFFHLKQGDRLSAETLSRLNGLARQALLPLDVLILGMGEDGHTASLFPCSDELAGGLDLDNPDALIKLVPKSASHQRISFTFASLRQSRTTFLHITGEAKKQVFERALNQSDIYAMPVSAFLQDPQVTTQVYWSA